MLVDDLTLLSVLDLFIQPAIAPSATNVMGHPLSNRTVFMTKYGDKNVLGE